MFSQTEKVIRRTSCPLVPCGNSLPSVEKTAVNQRFLRFWKKNGCVFLFPQNGNAEIDLPQG